jgi:hypothetical protein
MTAIVHYTRVVRAGGREMFRARRNLALLRDEGMIPPTVANPLAIRYA